MAERRMIAKTVVESDAFIDMPSTARLLYYDLNVRADDDGFINSPKKIQRMIGASEDDLKLLIAKKFVIPFESGVIVIKHWRIHNYIQKDRYKPTVYQDEMKRLEVKDNGRYSLLDTECIQNVSTLEAQVRLGKVRLGKVRLGKETLPTETDKKIKYADFVEMTSEEYAKLVCSLGEQDTQRCITILDNYKGANGKKYKSDYRAILNWVIQRCKDEKQKEIKGKGNTFLDILREEGGM